MKEIELESKISEDKISKISDINKIPTRFGSTTISSMETELTEEQMKHRVSFNKRNIKNNLYQNNIDQSIAFIIPYKYKFSFINILLLGIPYIISKISNKKYPHFRGEPCFVPNANFYVIIDEYGNYHICHFEKKNFTAKKNSITSQFMNISFKDEKNEFHIITYGYNKYFCYRKYTQRSGNPIFKNASYVFESPFFSLGKYTNKDIYTKFKNFFLTQEEENFQTPIYGKNNLHMESLYYFTTLLQQFKNLFFIFLYFQ